MKRSFGSPLIGAVLCLVPAALCQESDVEPGTKLRITVRVFNYARLPTRELSRATDFARAVFQRAGVSLVWLRCQISPELAGRNPACGAPVQPVDLLLNILNESMSKRMGLKDSCFGYALHQTESFSRLAGVDSNRALALERRAKVPRPIILGIFIAHELGHLLLSDRSHSSDGIMRASWSPRTLRRAAGSIPEFSPLEAERIRSNVRERLEQVAHNKTWIGGSYEVASAKALVSSKR